MKKGNPYRSLVDVYCVLREFSAIREVSDAVGMTPQGLRQKCFQTQFFTERERDRALAKIAEMRDRLSELHDAVRTLPTRVEL